MNCINPIYKLVEYLNAQITNNTTDATFLVLLRNTLNVPLSGYSISKKLNPNLCCPDCPTYDCNGGTYFFGNIVNAILFTQAYITERESGKIKEDRICCGNILSNYDGTNQEGITTLLSLYYCCNDFLKHFKDSFLLKLETLYDENNLVHVSMCNDYPYTTVISNGIVEYSLFNGNSALGDIIAASDLILNDSFRFIFLMYILNEGIVITCSECAQVNNTINIMTTSNFIQHCIEVEIIP